MNKYIASTVVTDLQPTIEGGCEIKHVVSVEFELDGQNKAIDFHLSERDLYTMKMTLKQGVLEGHKLMKSLTGLSIDLGSAQLAASYSF